MRALVGRPVNMSLGARLGFLAWLPSAAFALSACAVDLGPDGLGLTPRLPYETQVFEVAREPWAGEPVHIEVQHGNVEVVGVPGATDVRIAGRVLTWTRDRADVQAMYELVRSGLRVERAPDGALRILCAEAPHDVGDAQASATQCNVRVELPAPEQVEHALTAVAHFGDVYLNRLQSGADSALVARGIEVEGVLLRGNVHLQSEWGDAEVEPRAGGTVYLGSGTGDWFNLPTLLPTPKRDERDESARFGATLRLPQDFSAEEVRLSSVGAAVETPHFSDVVPGQPRGPLGPHSARRIEVAANQGNATLLAVERGHTLSRSGAFGTDSRTPWSEPQPGMNAQAR